VILQQVASQVKEDHIPNRGMQQFPSINSQTPLARRLSGDKALKVGEWAALRRPYPMRNEYRRGADERVLEKYV